MQYTFVHGDIQKLLSHFNMKKTGRNGKVYKGKGKDGIYRVCTYHYKSKNKHIADGTAPKIAHSLKFKNLEEMKSYLDTI